MAVNKIRQTVKKKHWLQKSGMYFATKSHQKYKIPSYIKR